MLNKTLSFLLRMLIIASVMLCVLQGAAFVMGTSSLLQTLFVVALGVLLTYKIEQMDSRLARARQRKKCPALHAAAPKAAIRVA